MSCYVFPRMLYINPLTFICCSANSKQSQMADRVLVIGSGGREHALAWKLATSPQVKQVLVAPGNAGTAANGKISNSAVLTSNHTILVQFCKDHNIGLVVAGPEALLAAGIVDDLVAAGVRCFGPTAKAAQLGTNRSFGNVFLDQHGIPAARWNTFTNPQEACTFITSADFPALVVKPSGLGPTKEVVIASSREEACKAAQEILQDNIFGDIRETVIIEELLKGEEFTYLCFVDGVTFAPMPPVQVQKRLLDGDQGPSTIGMGAYGPVPQISQVLLEKITSTLVQHILDCMKQEGMSYAGVLQIEFILTKDGVKVLNCSCHFGELQCQVVLQLLRNDLYEVMQATINGTLCDFTLAWSDNCTAVSIVMASDGCPEHYNKGKEITGLLQAKERGLEIFHGATITQDDKVVTNGNRVLTVTAVKKDLMSALEEAYNGLAAIYFHGATYRKDVGYQAMRFLGHFMSPSYEDRIADSIACHVLLHSSKLPAANGFKSEIAGSRGHQGRFPAAFDLRASGYCDPILVSQTKGIGTKLKIAQLCNKHNMIGQDLVAMCVNDILVHGAEPLFFLDYFACGKLDVGIAQAITDGIAEACKLAGCALLGRETNEMPNMCSPGEYNLIGFAVGAVERGRKLPQQERIVDGDILIGIASSGLHSQGFSLVRKILLTSSLHYFSPVPGACGAQTLGEQLLTPAKIYSKVLLPVLRSGNVKAYIHIAEGGILGSLSQILPEQFSVVLDAHNWKIPEVFSWLQEEGSLSGGEMAQMFNCGIGAVLVVEKEVAGRILTDVQKYEDAWLIGKVIRHLAGSPLVEIKNLHEALLQNKSPFLQNVSEVDCLIQTPRAKRKVNVAVLISGAGTSLAALITYVKEPASCAQVVVVITNRSGMEELKNATRAGIPTRVIDHKLYGSRSEYDGTIDRVLEEFSVELICLAGFMRVLSNNFLKKWNGKILSTYPSLSPLTKGGNAHKQALPSPEKVAGCTVHFVLEDTNLEAVILQEPVSIKIEDTEETLSEKVKEAENRVFPIALQLVASGMVQLGADGKTYWKRESWKSIHRKESQHCSSS
ncbi:trifunctional purine biosynthetic protein adenosine-3-like [Hemicordylus capensis]|uniref:trifunctional purine biosynthetic protein adenosine-3-like n=1 Tax=Hemicordylus capensis TaxID=884348 RepID=UPI002304CEF6|nr:trifunctional purine biosynthetic protein adenosine-3-like [Hemicordylus capensis]